MDFGTAIKSGFRNIFKYNGRASRSEFWWFQLFSVLSFVGIMLVDTVIAGFSGNSGSSGTSGSDNLNIVAAIFAIVFGLVFFVYFIALFLATLSLIVRRLHDSDKSGWFILLSFIPFGGIVLLVFYCLPGTAGPNQYGPDPLGSPLNVARTFE